MNPYAEAGIDFLKAIASPVLTVLLSALFVQRFFVSRANEAFMVDFLIKELEELRNDALLYWNDATSDKRAKSVLAQKIKGNLRALSSDIRFFYRRYCKKEEEKYSGLLMDIHDSCTGGDFESKNAKVDANRYITIVNAINQIKSELLRRKL